MSLISEKVEAIVGPTLARMGYELIDLQLKTGGHRGVLRLFIDAPEGVGLEDCEKVSHQVSGLLDVEDPIPGAYELEVSSPGLDRRLRRREHFERFAGAEIRAELAASQEGRRRFRGELLGIDEEEQVRMKVDGVEYRLPLNDIEIARLVPEL